jgi:proline dehydrogenase
VHARVELISAGESFDKLKTGAGCSPTSHAGSERYARRGETGLAPDGRESVTEQSNGRLLSVNGAFRKGILLATHNRLVTRGVKRFGMRLGASNFVAGEDLDECIRTLRELTDRGFHSNTTLLGEGVTDEHMASEVADEYIEILNRIEADKCRTNIALKLSHLGLDLGEEVAYRNLEHIVAHAEELGNFIRIDMEESFRVDATLRIYKRLRAEGFENVGTVLQSYLFRSEDDLDSLLSLKPNLRIVKGAYLEPPEIAFAYKLDVDAGFIKLTEKLIENDCYAGIATHDDRIIDYFKAFTERHGVGRDKFEFQMLYGIRTQYQQELLDEGYKVRIATPFGPEWYHYLMRRLAERPANLLFLMKNLVRR